MNFKEWVKTIKEIVSIEDVLDMCDVEYSAGLMICPNPSHGDRHLGSCTYDSDANSYRCWACNDYGDILSLVMKRKNLSFRESCDFIVKNYNSTHSTKIPESYSKDSFNSAKAVYIGTKELEYLNLKSQVITSTL